MMQLCFHLRYWYLAVQCMSLARAEVRWLPFEANATNFKMLHLVK